ncbi:cysteine desulfurase family protein [Metabacillus sp. RGM 3146]|uniref:cysteine desulfurase family protein n=1 Tax=Metabacillus sp. RGM 3146 TaxID=3401092 RepID=UPI003B9CD566
MLYMDNSATTKPFPEVLDTYRQVSETFFGNPSSLHKLGGQAEHLIQQARKQVSNILDTKEEEIIFTSGGTEGNNMAIKGIALAHMNRGRHIIISSIEHPSVIEACKQLEKFFHFEITMLPVNQAGFVQIDDLKQSLRDDTILVSIMHVNNELGTIQPVEEIGRLLSDRPNTFFHIDHVQGAAKVPLNIKMSQADLCTMSAHKFHGLKGTGILFVKKGVELLPLHSGGSQERGYRSGTENTAGIVAAAKALRMASEKYKEKKRMLEETKSSLMNALEKLDGIVLNTISTGTAPHIVNFSVPGIKPEVLVHQLEEKDIYLSTTSACSSRQNAVSQTLLAAGKGEEIARSVLRISLSFEHSPEIVPYLVKTIEQSIQHLKKVTR